MPASISSKELRAFCHEHHVEMRLNEGFLNSEGNGEAARMLAYGCPEPDCLVHYNVTRGYFLVGENGNKNELEMVPKVQCFLDGTRMYLAATSPEKKDFRLWRCPQCGASLTNEEGLAGLPPSRKIQDVSGKNGVRP